MDEKARAAGSIQSLSLSGKGEGRSSARVEILVYACAILACLALFVGLLAPHAAFADEEEDEDKVGKPVITVQVAEEEDGTLTWGDAADAQAEETVSYRATSTLPTDWEDYETYYYMICISYDDALDVDVSALAVTLYDENGEELVDLTEEGVITEEDGSFTIFFEDLKETFAAVLGEDSAESDESAAELETLAVEEESSDDESASAEAGYEIVVTWEASLDAEATESGADGAAYTYGYLIYKLEPKAGTLQSSVEDYAVLYTWALDLTKVDLTTEAALSGATFTIQNSDGEYVDLDGTLTTTAIEHETGADGSFDVSGLDSGTYTITEVTAPAGYDKIDAFTLEIAADLDGDAVSLSAAIAGNDVSITSVDASAGVVSVQVDEGLSADDGSGAGDGSGDGGLFAQTGDATGYVVLGIVAVAAVAAIVLVVASRRKATADVGREGKER